MAGYKVEICGVNTSDLPLLKPAQAKELLVKIKSGDTQARETFIKGNLRLVLSIVQRFNQSGENLDDLFQIGCIGLCKAAATDKGGCFSTYAYRLIWNEICSALIYANRRAGKEIPTEPEILSTYEAEIVPEQSDNTLTALLDEAERSASGVTAKGIRALRLMADGYTAREIGEQMGASANNVTAWVSRARRYLREIGRCCT